MGHESRRIGFPSSDVSLSESSQKYIIKILKPYDCCAQWSSLSEYGILCSKEQVRPINPNGSSSDLTILAQPFRHSHMCVMGRERCTYWNMGIFWCLQPTCFPLISTWQLVTSWFTRNWYFWFMVFFVIGVTVVGSCFHPWDQLIESVMSLRHQMEGNIWKFSAGRFLGGGFKLNLAAGDIQKMAKNGFKLFLFLPGSAGKWSNLTSIFFKWVETTNWIPIYIVNRSLSLSLQSWTWKSYNRYPVQQEPLPDFHGERTHSHDNISWCGHLSRLALRGIWQFRVQVW